MNGQDDAQVRIGAYIDPTGATAGAKVVVDDVDRIKGATLGAAEGGTRMVEQLGRLREAHHLLAAIGEIARGGTDALAGEAMGVRFLGEAFESLIPGGAVLVALATVISLGASMVARQQEHNDKLGDAKKKTDDLKDSVDTLKDSEDARARAAEEAMKAFDDRTRAEADAFADEKAQNTDRVDAMKKEVDLQKQLVDATLDLARARQLANNTAGPAGAEAINEQYDAWKKAADTNAEFKKIEIERNQVEAQQAATGQQYAQEQANRDNLQKQLDAMMAQQQAMADKAQRAGLAPDKDGKGYRTAYSGFKAQVEDLERRWEAIQGQMGSMERAKGEQDAVGAGGVPGLTPDYYAKKIAELKKQQEEIEAAQRGAMFMERVAAQADEAKKLSDAGGGAGAEDLRKKIEESDKKLNGLAEDNRKLHEQMTDLAYQAKITSTQQAADAAKGQRDNAEKQQGLSDKDFEGENKAAIDRQQAILDDKSQSTMARMAAALEVERLKNVALQRKIDEAGKKGADKLTPGELDALRAEQGLNTQSGKDKAADIQQSDERKEGDAEKVAARAQLESQRREIDQLKEELSVKFKGNAQVEAYVKSIDATFKDNPTEELARLHGVFAESAETLTNAVASMRQELSATNKKVERLQHATNSLKNTYNN